MSHLKAAGRNNHGRAAEALGVLDDARNEGLRVHQDAYPYAAGSTLLTQLLPALGPRRRDRRDGRPPCGSADVRARIAADVRDGLPGWADYIVATGGWDGIRIAAVVDPALAWLEGKTVAESAASRDLDPFTLALDTMAADRGATMMIVSLMSDADVDAILADPSTSIGSDQLGVLSREAASIRGRTGRSSASSAATSASAARSTCRRPSGG